MTNLQIAKLYVAVNGTAPTAAELATLSASATTAADIMAMVDFTGADNTATLNAAYQAAFGRDADAEGLAYWGAELTAGNVTGATLMEKLLVGADVYVSAGDATIAALNTADKGITANKATVALEIATAGLTATEAATALALVTATDTAAASASVTAVVDAAAAAAQAEEDAAAAVGQTIVFTTAIDALTGTTGNDTFVGDNTLTTSAADQIAGSTGTDTVKIYNDSATALTMPVLDSIENLYVKNIDPSDSQDISGLGITTFEMDSGDMSAAATTITYAAGQKVILDSVTNTAGTTTVATNATTNSVIVAAKTAAVTSADIEVDGVSGTVTTNQQALAGLVVSITGTGVKTLNLTASGDDSVAIISNAALTTVNVDGSADLSLDIDTAVSLTTFDASAATGDVTVDVSNSTLNIAIDGGAGDDSLTADLSVNVAIDAGAGDDTVTFASTTIANLDAFDTIEGGEGMDTLALSAIGANAFDASTKLAQITNFEALKLTSDLGAADGVNTIDNIVDVSKFGFNSVNIAAATTTTTGTITGMTSGATVTYSAAADSSADLLIAMTGATGAGTNADTLNVTFSSDLILNANHSLLLDVEGINIINVDANDSLNTDGATDATEGYTLDLDGAAGNGNDTNVTTLNVTGTSALSYTASTTATALSTVDASASTGDMTIALNAFAGTQGIVYTGSEGIDTVTSTKFADLITLGTGKDVVTILATTSTEAAMDKVSDFDITAAGDKVVTVSGAIGVDLSTAIDVSGADAAAGSVEITAKVKDGIVSLYGADSALIDTLAEWIDVVETAGVVTDTAANAAGDSLGAVAFEFSGNTYVVDVNDANNDNNFDGGTAAVIELTGVTGVTSLSLANVADSIFVV